MLLRGPFRERKKHHNHNEIPHLDVHPDVHADVHLDVRFIMAMVLGLSLLLEKNQSRRFGKGMRRSTFQWKKGFSVKRGRQFSESEVWWGFLQERQFSEEVRAIHWTAGLWKLKNGCPHPLPQNKLLKKAKTHKKKEEHRKTKKARNFRVGFWQNGFFADFYFWAAGFFCGFSRRIFSPHFCGKKCPEKSSRKIPAKILQDLYNKNPPTHFCRMAGARNCKKKKKQKTLEVQGCYLQCMCAIALSAAMTSPSLRHYFRKSKELLSKVERILRRPILGSSVWTSFLAINNSSGHFLGRHAINRQLTDI